MPVGRTFLARLRGKGADVFARRAGGLGRASSTSSTLSHLPIGQDLAMPAKTELSRAPAGAGRGCACSTSRALTCLPVGQGLTMLERAGLSRAPADTGRGCACSTSSTLTCPLDERGVNVPAGWAGLENASEGRTLSRTCKRRARVCLVDEGEFNVTARRAGRG